MEGAMFGAVGVLGDWLALSWDICMCVALKISALHGCRY